MNQALAQAKLIAQAYLDLLKVNPDADMEDVPAEVEPIFQAAANAYIAMECGTPNEADICEYILCSDDDRFDDSDDCLLPYA